MMNEESNVLAIDFDGVIIREGSGFTRERLENRPVSGSILAIEKLKAEGWKIVIHSCRARDPEGKAQIINWLTRFGLYDKNLEITSQKPWAKYYIDDRAIEFVNWDSVMKRLCNESEG